jgi:hypothetical protein
MENQKKKFINFTREKKLIQVFPEVCKYSCSKHGEERNFVLIREYYLLQIYKFKFRLWESVSITCDNCHWTSRIPAIFAKKVFKNGLKSHLLITYAKSRIVTSRILNTWGATWRIWLLTFGVLALLTIFRFTAEPVQISEPVKVSFADILSQDNLGKIVEISGKVDYTLSFARKIYIQNEIYTLLESEVYFPMFANDNLDFVVIKGGAENLNTVTSSLGGTNYDSLKNQDYTVIGRLETLSNLENQDLVRFFRDELPQRKSLNTPKLIINAADIKTLRQFADEFAPYYAFVMLFLTSSIFIQIFIDRKVFRS